jgi:hypothetical protein
LWRSCGCNNLTSTGVWFVLINYLLSKLHDKQ